MSKSGYDIVPIGKRILVKPIEQKYEKTKSNILIEKKEVSYMKGEVFSSGTGDFKKGQIVLYGKHAGVSIEGHLIINESDVLAITKTI